MSKWGKMDHKAWEDSEVMLEFEKLMVRSAVELSKKAQQAQQISQKLDQIKTNVEDTSKSMGDFLEQADNLAEDEQIELTEEEEYAAAKSALLEELNQLAIEAGKKGDYKQAYMIERTMDRVLFEE